MSNDEPNAGEKLFSAICKTCGAEWIGPHSSGPRRCLADHNGDNCGGAEFTCTEVVVHIATAPTKAAT